MKHSRVAAASLAGVIAASLAGPLPARGGDFPFPERVISTTADGAHSVFATDLDGDGDTDVLSALPNDRIVWYESDGGSPPSFTERVISIIAISARSVFATDVDGDGGNTFDVLRAGLPGPYAYDLTFRHALDVDETGDRLVFGSTTGSLWVSENQGDAWQCVSQHLPPIHCTRFVK